jgi:hypothetical protein
MPESGGSESAAHEERRHDPQDPGSQGRPPGSRVRALFGTRQGEPRGLGIPLNAAIAAHLAGHDRDDADHYLEKQVRESIAAARAWEEHINGNGESADRSDS